MNSKIVLTLVIFTFAADSHATETPDPNDPNRYLDAVREFADNVLKYGRDTYGPKHTPLFVDGLNIHTHEPVKWIAPNGDRWILSNLASQQNLFRTLDGLTRITGDPKYKKAGMDAIKYTFENLRSPNGLLYWGAVAAYDASGDRPCGYDNMHVFKAFYPYYELMWQVNPEVTRQIIESFWASHILNWSNLEMDRIGPLDQLNVPKGWEQEYEGGPVFFSSSKRPIAATGSDLYYAAAVLCKLSGQKGPLIWGKRLAHRYVETRNPKTGISAYVYTLYGDASQHPLSEDFKGQIIESSLLFPPGIEQMIYAEIRECKLGYLIVSPGIPYSTVSGPWICCLSVGELLGNEGREFTQWALEELTACGKVAYRDKDNVWIPLLPDGTSLEGYKYKEAGFYGPKGTTFKAISAVPMDFWAYALAYRLTNDQFIWKMVYNIALGSGLGNIGITSESELGLQIPTDHCDPYTLLAFLELYKKTETTEFLQAAQKIGDNILRIRFHKGFFIPSNKHIYTKFDAIEALTLLHLTAAKQNQGLLLPQVLPGRPLFNLPFRDKEAEVDNSLIYTLTESSIPPRSLQEAAACNDVDLVKSLIAQGVDVNSMEGLSLDTAVRRATIEGHEDVVKLLLANGAYIDAKDADLGGTPLHHAVEKGHKRIVELLIGWGADINATKLYFPLGDTPLHTAVRAENKDITELLIDKGVDLNAKNNQDQTPLDIAVNSNSQEIADLLYQKGAVISTIHAAASFGNLDTVKSFIKVGVNVNEKDESGMTPLLQAVAGGHTDVAELLIDAGADLNSGNKHGVVPLFRALWNTDLDMLELLLKKGADVDTKHARFGFTALHWAAMMDSKDSVELILGAGADVNDKCNTGETPLDVVASWGVSTEMSELLVAKGAEVSSLHTAAFMGDLPKVKALINNGVEVDKKSGMIAVTALYSAAAAGHKETVEFLISKGADVNAQDGQGNTPLHIASEKGHLEVVELLIEKGADVNAKNNAGQTPIDVVGARNRKEIVELLWKHGAKE